MKPETIALVSAAVGAVSAMGSIASAVVSHFNGKRQTKAAQAVAQKQIESAREVALDNLIMPMREAWIGPGWRVPSRSPLPCFGPGTWK